MTITYSTGKPYSVGAYVLITGMMPAAYNNGGVPVQVTSADQSGSPTFSYALANDPGTYTTGTGEFTIVMVNNLANLAANSFTFNSSGDPAIVTGPKDSSGNPVVGGVALNLVGSSTITESNSGSGGLTLTGAITNKTPQGVVNYVGTGTLSLAVPAANSIPNAYAGLNITGGTVKDLLPEQIPDTANVTLNGGVLNLNGQTETIGGLTVLTSATFGNPAVLMVGSGGLTLANGPAATSTTLSIGNQLILSGNLADSGDLTNNITGGGKLVLNGNRNFNVADGASATDLSISNVIADGATLGGITKIGSGTLVLSGNNTFTGGVTVNGGVLSTTNAFPAINSLAVSNLNTTTTGTNVVLNLPTTVPSTFASLSGSVAVPLSGTNTATINNGGQLLTVNPAVAATFAGTITGGGGFSLTSTLASNSLTLAGTNTYTGSTTLGSSATLIVNGSTDPASTVVVGSAATLGGTGTVGGSVIVNGTLKPATATTTGTLTIGAAGVGDVTFLAGSAFDVNLTASGTDELVVSGAALLTNATLNVNGADNAPIGVPITILHAGNLANTFFVGLPDGTMFMSAGQTYTINYDYVGNNVTLIHWHSPAFTSSDHTGFVVGTPSSFNVTTSGYPAVTLTEDPTDAPLPASITFSPTTGVLTGTPVTADIGVYTLHFIAHSGFGSDALQTFTLTIGVPPAFTNSNFTLFNVGSNGNFPLAASGMPSPTFAESPTDTLPAGVSLVGGTLTGTPTTAGIYTLHFTAANGTVDAAQTFTLFVGPLTTVYVSSALAGSTAGQFIPDADNIASGAQPAIFGTSAFATIGDALSATSSTSDTILVSAGTYSESPILAGTQTLALNGDVVVDSIDSAVGSTIDLRTHNLTTGDAAGANTLAGLVTGAGGLTKVGSDTLAITANDNYSGGTTVSAGSLLVNGSLNTSGTVSITGSGILGGTGTVGNVTNSATVNPGVPGTPGALTVAGNLTLGPGSLVLDLTNTSTFDSVLANGSTNITGTSLSLNIGTGVINSGDTFTILDVPSASPVVTGMFVNLPTSGSTFTVGSQTFSINYAGGPNNNDVVLTAVSPVSVTSTIQNGGIPYINNTLAAAQHSMIENLVYSFSSAINLSPSNFTISGLAGSGTTIVPTLNISANGTNTVWTVTFTGAGVDTTTHSIGDGEYQIVLGGVSGLTSNTYDFFRLMGDMDGTGLVNIADFNTMVGTFGRATNDPAYLGAADLDGDGTIGIADINLLIGNFLHSVPQPLPN